MGFFDLFKQSNINQGIEEYKRTGDTWFERLMAE